MDRFADLVEKIRSKNAGPFWITVDIFCGDNARFDDISGRLDTDQICVMLRLDPADVERYDIADLAVIKFSIIRPNVQGSRFDRDMHGAQLAELFAEMII